MWKKLLLGIETSCDETAAAVIRENKKGAADILSNVVSSQQRNIKNLVALSLNWLLASFRKNRFYYQ